MISAEEGWKNGVLGVCFSEEKRKTKIEERREWWAAGNETKGKERAVGGRKKREKGKKRKRKSQLEKERKRGKREKENLRKSVSNVVFNKLGICEIIYCHKHNMTISLMGIYLYNPKLIICQIQ